EVEDRALVEKIASSLSINVPVICVPGGATRQESVAAALAQLPIDVEFVAVHDAARAFCSPELIKEVINQAQHSGAAILATPAKSTLKLVNNNSIIETIDRSQIWEAQTPQVFKKNILLEAHQRAAQDQVVGTDECQLVERTGLEVRIVKGEDSNFKITTPEDLLYARWLLRGEKS
ncbi:UNVERIFIED_CONTAM: hypothetical protein GTU68_051360, partial [Idotea baltica]|nr:hypothetical protein [Idotea baltica]